ncbi:MAG: sugar ABC transporter ATP-binding protein [Lachnospiraceae bacterium]
MNQNKVLLRTEHMFKSFGVTKALRDVSLDVKAGQVLGLIGENGSGKSTISLIIAALQSADEGTMFLEDNPYNPKSSVEAIKSGICMILQEKGTFDMLSVAKNIFVGKEELFVKHGLLSNRSMIKAAREALDLIHAEHIQADIPISKLNFEDRKLVEVARAMYSNPKILIVDETTTALSRNGRDILYKIMEDMKSAGKAVIFISHDLDEIMEVCDAVTILRDGIYIDSLEKAEFDAASLRKLMVGREVSENYYRMDTVSCKNEEVVLRVDHLFCQDIKGVSFELHKGEILGFGGLGDCGMHILGNAAFGLTEPDIGTVSSGNGTVIKNANIAMKNRIAYISKNRDQETLMVSCSVKDNVCLASYDKISRGPLILKKDEEHFVEENAGQLEIKMQNSNQYVMELSGGNKQKVALAKWLGFGADIFILDCPTRGIDIGVKSNIYQLMIQLREAGKSIIMISEELAEVIGMSDRVIILREGQISGQFKREDNVTEHLLIDYMV